MSSSEAQKSPVHQSTEDSTTEPTGARASAQSPAGDRNKPPSRDAGGSRDRDLARDAASLKSRPDTAMGVPGNFERGAAMADVHPDSDAEANPAGTAAIGGGPGAGDASSGGGAGAGIPGGGTDLRTGGAFSGGDADKDRQKLFPDAGRQANAPGRAGGDDTAVGKDPDESTYGGPLDLDDPKAV